MQPAPLPPTLNPLRAMRRATPPSDTVVDLVRRGRRVDAIILHMRAARIPFEDAAGIVARLDAATAVSRPLRGARPSSRPTLT